MKNGKSLVLIALLVIAQSVFAAEITQGLGSTLSIAGLQYIPSPAVPGQYIDVWFTIQNSKFDATEIQCQLEPQYPFSLDTNEQAGRFIGNLGAGQNVVLKYKVRVDTNAVLGDNKLALSCKTGTSDLVKAELAVSVQTQAKSLAVGSIMLSNELEPGSNAILSIQLKNEASIPLRDVSVKLDLTGSDVPFVPLEGSTEKRISLLGGKASETLNYKISALATAEPKAYKIPLQISYKDDLGNAYTLDDTVGVIISAKPSLEAYVEESKILRDNTGGMILVKVVNSGLSEAKFLNIKALDTPTVRVVEPRAYYVGSLASDDFETIEYKLFVSGAGDRGVMPVVFSYRDANNNQYEQEAAIEFKLYSDAEISQLQLEPSRGMDWLLVIVLIAIAFLAYKFALKKHFNLKF
ncbi:MAG TPA: hypothetical protein VJI71_03385 [Candidatus Norongarragalinales archaeon]|nr:hypothetical protein [Candidatus Norongarragalinales archaeon]